MKLNKRNISLVITIVIGSLVGLTTLQYQLLKDSIDINKQIFTQKIDLATEEVGVNYREDIELPNVVHQYYSDPDSGISEAEVNYHIKELIDLSLQNYNIPVSYKYGIYTHNENDQLGFKLIGGDSPSELDPHKCVNSPDIDFGFTSLTCNKGFGKDNSYHLGVFFPDNSTYLLTTAKIPIVSSAILLILLILSFMFTILTIKKQRKLSEIKNDFINNMTHEFKTPIFSIALATGILKKSKKLSSDQKLSKYIEVIGSESKRLKSQVDKVLQMALVDSGNFQLEKESINMHDLISETAKSFEVLLKEKDGSLRLALTASDPIILGDKIHLNNIIQNLLDNAQKYSKESPRITISTEDHPEGFQLMVKDNGIGISEDVQHYVFDKFYRVESGNIHNVKGFGLGLSYVKKVMEAHKGLINIISSPNSGSQFILQFPRS